MPTTLRINGSNHEVDLPQDVPLLWVLRDEIGLTGTKAKNSEGVMDEGYTLTLGGSQGPNPSVGEVERKAIPAEDIKTVLKEVLIEKFGATPKG